MNAERSFLIVTLIGAILGLRGSLRLTRRYVDVSPVLIRRERLLLGAIVGVAWVITFAAGWFAFFSARRLLGFAAIDWTPVGSLIIATIVLYIPAVLDYVVGLVARVPWK